MSCIKRCPHHVRHGRAGEDGKTIIFSDMCGLRMKDKKECPNAPFSVTFNHYQCQIYQDTFKSSVERNDVVPTKDFQFSEALSGGSITDMDLL